MSYEGLFVCCGEGGNLVNAQQKKKQSAWSKKSERSGEERRRKVKVKTAVSL